MVRNYKRKTERGNWSEGSMKNAVKDVIEGKMGYQLASKTYSVPKTTLKRKVNIARAASEDRAAPIISIKVPLGRKKPIFSDDEEKELCNYLMDMESRRFGLTTKDVGALAYTLAVKNGKQHLFNSGKQEAGKDWLQGFLNRHPELSIHKPENTSAARAAGFFKQAPGAWGVFSDSGWMTAELFLGWFKKFIEFSGATVDRPSVFNDIDFAPLLMTNIPQTEGLSITEALPQTTSLDNGPTAPNTQFPSAETSFEPEPQPGCSNWITNVENDQRPATPPSVFSFVTPQQVMPFPATRKILRVTRKRGKTAIITSSPYRKDLEETIKKRHF